MRLDKYLWAVRLYKTRSLAADACQCGKVKLIDSSPKIGEGDPNKVRGEEYRSLKPSHEVREGERYSLNIDQLHKEVEVLAIPPNRVGAPLVPGFLIDRTPQEEYERIQMARRYAFEHRDRGEGRPTKRDRRDIEKFKYE